MNVLPQNVSIIPENDLCISCGACRHACPAQEITIEYRVTKGIYEPVIQNTVACDTCSTKPCLQVCPSYQVDFRALANWMDEEEVFGPVEGVYLGKSSSAEIQRRASSGGVIREICRYYLENDLADGVVSLKHAGGLDYKAEIFRDPAEMNSMPGSIYHNFSFESVIDILKNSSERLVLVATPCQLTAIKKWATLFQADLRAQLVLSIGLICGWMFSRNSLVHFLKSQGILEKPTEVSYRGGDKVGQLRIKTGQREFQFSRRPQIHRDSHTAAFRTAFSRSYNTRRCLVCVDHLNYLADVSVGDAWLDAFARESLGTSLVVTRNERIDKLIHQMIKGQRLDLITGKKEDIVESQSRDLALGISAEALICGMKRRGEFYPEFIRPLLPVRKRSLSLYWVSELFPSWVRKLNRAGFGYSFFKARVPFMYLRLTITSLIRQAMSLIPFGTQLRRRFKRWKYS